MTTASQRHLMVGDCQIGRDDLEASRGRVGVPGHFVSELQCPACACVTFTASYRSGVVTLRCAGCPVGRVELVLGFTGNVTEPSK